MSQPAPAMPARSPNDRVTIAAADAVRLATRVFVAVGSPPDEATIVAADLAEADLLGLPSHGLMRIPEYVRAARSGDAVPGAPLQVVAETASAALVDGGRNFGQVVGRKALAIAIAKATVTGSATVVVRNSHHLGRLGALAQAAADQGLVCLTAATVRPRGHFVVPWGGREGRLGTNPIAYGLPTNGPAIVSDFATSVIPEGSVRLALAEGRQVVPGAIVDAEGRATTDPAAFYGPPMGALLPFGGDVGYKGYALALLAEALGGSLAGSRPDDQGRSANGLWLYVMDPAAFGAAVDFATGASELAEYMASAAPAPGVDRVLLPGEREAQRRARSGDSVSLDAAVWEAIGVVTRELEVPW